MCDAWNSKRWHLAAEIVQFATTIQVVTAAITFACIVCCWTCIVSSWARICVSTASETGIMVVVLVQVQGQAFFELEDGSRLPG